MSKQSSGRNQRIEAQMQRTLALLLPRAVKDPRVGPVTVTTVRLNTDKSVATVFFLPFGGKHAAEEVLAGLQSSAGFLRGEVGRQLQLRHAPRLDFQIDTDLERAQHLTDLIGKATAQDRGGT